MSSELKWTISLGLVATCLATGLVAVVFPMSVMSLLGWAMSLELLQLPMIAAARHGRLDPCTAWFRRVLGAERGGT
jgi:hypothetical protein